MRGYNVFQPQGFDAFGLPAENFAIKNDIHPAVSTQKNIDTMRKQLHSIGAMYDWKNEINTNGFEKTAIRYSKSESASKGGRLGWLKETMISKEFRKVLKNTNIGSTSEPILTSQGILFLKLEDKRILESAIDLEKEKNKLLKSEKDKKLHMYALSHFNKIKQSIAIEYNIQ